PGERVAVRRVSRDGRLPGHRRMLHGARRSRDACAVMGAGGDDREGRALDGQGTRSRSRPFGEEIIQTVVGIVARIANLVALWLVIEILHWLSTGGAFLWETGRYRIEGTRGSAVLVASDDVRLWFMWSNGELAVAVEAARAGPVVGRYRLRQLVELTGREVPAAASDAALLRGSLAAIEFFLRMRAPAFAR